MLLFFFFFLTKSDRAVRCCSAFCLCLPALSLGSVRDGCSGLLLLHKPQRIGLSRGFCWCGLRETGLVQNMRGIRGAAESCTCVAGRV